MAHSAAIFKIASSQQPVLDICIFCFNFQVQCSSFWFTASGIEIRVLTFDKFRRAPTFFKILAVLPDCSQFVSLLYGGFKKWQEISCKKSYRRLRDLDSNVPFNNKTKSSKMWKSWKFEKFKTGVLRYFFLGSPLWFGKFHEVFRNSRKKFEFEFSYFRRWFFQKF